MLFLKKQFYKQRQAETDKKASKKLSNTLRLNFCYLKLFALNFIHVIIQK